jgi:hypothetical protein
LHFLHELMLAKRKWSYFFYKISNKKCYLSKNYNTLSYIMSHRTTLQIFLKICYVNKLVSINAKLMNFNKLKIVYHANNPLRYICHRITHCFKSIIYSVTKSCWRVLSRQDFIKLSVFNLTCRLRNIDIFFVNEKSYLSGQVFIMFILLL